MECFYISLYKGHMWNKMECTSSAPSGTFVFRSKSKSKMNFYYKRIHQISLQKSLTFSEQVKYCLSDYYLVTKYKTKRKIMKSCSGLMLLSFFVHKLLIHFGWVGPQLHVQVFIYVIHFHLAHITWFICIFLEWPVQPGFKTGCLERGKKLRKCIKTICSCLAVFMSSW